MSTVLSPAVHSGKIIAPQRFHTLTLVEVRKMTSTRSGRAVLAAVLFIALAAIVWELFHAGAIPPSWEGYSGVLPVIGTTLAMIGLLGMTAEWTQRTALTTFTLSPRRIRVLLSKIAAALLIGVVLTGIAVAFAMIAYPIASSHTTFATTNAGMGASIASTFIAVALNIIMGAGFGALLSISAAALVTYFAAPLLFATLGVQLLGTSAKWLDITGAIQNISQREIAGQWPQTITSIVVWIVLPMIAGLWVSAHREVK